MTTILHFNIRKIYQVVTVALLCTMCSVCGSSNRIMRENEHLKVSAIGSSVKIKSSQEEFSSLKCKSGSKAGEITVEYTGENKAYFLLMFEDLDLPNGSSIQIHQGLDASSPLYQNQPEFKDTAWTRPVVGFIGQGLYIEFDIPAVQDGCYVGFTGTVLIKSEIFTPSDPDPVTACPDIGHPGSSGIVQLSGYENVDDFKSVYYDCVWQIKPPSSLTNFKTFIRITNIYGGYLKINSGISSESNKLFQYDSTKESEVLTTDKVNQGQNGFTSEEGFYVHVKMPLYSEQRGKYNFMEFVHGIFQETTLETQGCHLMVRPDVEITGFHCNGFTWCVPKEYKCDRIAQCADGSDEKVTFCQDRASITSPPEPKRLPPTKSTLTSKIRMGSSFDTDFEYCVKKCTDGTCIKNFRRNCPRYHCDKTYEQTCTDGECIDKFDYNKACDGECPYLKKMCNGECIYDFQTCYYDEGCPSYKPLKCRTGNQCFSEEDKCNYWETCNDGTDDEGCPPKPEYNSSSVSVAPILSVITVLVILFVITIVIIIICRARKKQGHRTRNPNQNIHGGPLVTGTPMQPFTHPEATPTQNPRNQYTNNMNRPEAAEPTAPPPAADLPPSYEEAVMNQQPAY